MPVIKQAAFYNEIYLAPIVGIFVDGTESADWLYGTNYADEIHGRGGNDSLYAYAGNDKLFGDAGNDTLNGGAGSDVLDGGSGNDTANYAGAGIIIDLSSGMGFGGEAQGDTLISIENVLGTADSDILSGDAGANKFWGSFGDDWLFGQQGNDTLDGGYGSDTLIGGEGNDVLVGGFGNDRLTGDGPGVSGFDIFAFGRGHGADRIVDFVSGVDDIGLMGFSGAVFGSDGKLARGYVNEDGYFRGQNFDRAAHDQIYYNTQTHELWEIKYSEYIHFNWIGQEQNDLKIDWSQSRVLAVFENSAEPTTQDIFMMTY